MLQKKQIFKLDILRKFLNDPNSCISLVPSTRLLALPPFFLNNMKSGIFYLLNSTLKKYDRSLDGIVIGYQNVKILMDENTGVIPFGSAETQVNVSVEFYIFQPKIGNTLEGVINKKSNNHIGCLVHHYFNATILKPEDVEYEDWNCKDFDVNDKIVFKVKDLDFTGLLPYIEGIVNSEDLLDCVRSKRTNVCNLDVNKDFQSEAVRESSSIRENSLGSEMGESLESVAKESISNDLLKESGSDGRRAIKKKKKKKKKEKDDGDVSKFPAKEEEEDAFFEKFLRSDDHDDDFAKPIKSKKKKKKKDEETESKLNKNRESLPQRDELFYSTRLEINPESKMNASCSPIPKTVSGLANDRPRTPPSSSPSKGKRRERKRKAEDSADASAAKKLKKDQSQINGTTDFVDELLRQELEKVKEKLNMSEIKKEEKESDDSLYEKLMKEAKSDIAPKKNKDSDSISKKKKKKHKEKFRNGSMYDIDLSPEKPEKPKVDGRPFSDAEQSQQSSVKKKNVNGVATGKKSLVQTMLDQFFQEEGKKLISESDRDSVKEPTKEKKDTKPKTLPKGTESLYEQLLREAKSRIEVAEDSPPKKKRRTK